MNIIQCYAPTNDSKDDIKDQFYERLQPVIEKCLRKDLTILMRDLNAKVGIDNNGYEDIMGRHGLGQRNKNGERFANLCAFNKLVIGGTIFLNKRIHKATWISPDHTTENQIDHICINKKFRRTMEDVRTRRGAVVASDHHLVVVNLKLKLKKNWTSGQTALQKTLDRIKERKTKKAAINNSRTRAEKVQAQSEYTEANKQVKRSIRADKKKYVEELAKTTEEIRMAIRQIKKGKAAGSDNIPAEALKPNGNTTDHRRTIS
ncbi:unnamed protein product [Schistosoma margrebowiei]|uniref:Uncharacterized protein n=1 Tax=Schistosoma margrebowiei TaxID=48269 RepID=A0A183LC40_9TREM|nr:unnamed protein product [Schistosoma margrebowiei]